MSNNRKNIQRRIHIQGSFGRNKKQGHLRAGGPIWSASQYDRQMETQPDRRGDGHFGQRLKIPHTNRRTHRWALLPDHQTANKTGFFI